jgi:hypothetical protein
MILMVIDDGKTFVVAEGKSLARKGTRCAYTRVSSKEAQRALRGRLFCGSGPSTLAERETSMSVVAHQVVAALHRHMSWPHLAYSLHRPSLQ